jgi:hypothetical protein
MLLLGIFFGAKGAFFLLEAFKILKTSTLIHVTTNFPLLFGWTHVVKKFFQAGVFVIYLLSFYCKLGNNYYWLQHKAIEILSCCFNYTIPKHF